MSHTTGFSRDLKLKYFKTIDIDKYSLLIAIDLVDRVYIKHTLPKTIYEVLPKEVSLNIFQENNPDLQRVSRIQIISYVSGLFMMLTHSQIVKEHFPEELKLVKALYDKGSILGYRSLVFGEKGTLREFTEKILESDFWFADLAILIKWLDILKPNRKIPKDPLVQKIRKRYEEFKSKYEN